MRNLYYHYEDHIKRLHFEPAKSIIITQDASTSPNNFPFMLLTCHFITESWDLMDVTLVIAEIKGVNVFDFSILSTGFN